jgi:hypothetical protein
MVWKKLQKLTKIMIYVTVSLMYEYIVLVGQLVRTFNICSCMESLSISF